MAQPPPQPAPDEQPVGGSPEPIPGRCAARLRGKRKGRFCTHHPMPNGRCRMHGGASTGPAWKHGMRSKLLAPFRQALRQRAAAPDLLTDQALERLALMDEHEDAVLSRALEHGDSPEWRKEAMERFTEAARYANAKEFPSAIKALGRLGEHLKAGVPHDQAIAEAVRIAERRISRTVDLRNAMASERRAGDTLSQHLQMVLTVFIQVAIARLGAAAAQPLIRDTLAAYSGKGIALQPAAIPATAAANGSNGHANGKG